MIDKVVFSLHEDFKKPTRVLTSPPFEVEEIGCGEFEIPVTIYFCEYAREPLELILF
eukprot:UN28165